MKKLKMTAVTSSPSQSSSDTLVLISPGIISIFSSAISPNMSTNSMCLISSMGRGEFP